MNIQKSKTSKIRVSNNNARTKALPGKETSDGGLGVRSPTDVHDETVLLQLVRRCAPAAAETALGRSVRLEAAQCGSVARMGWLALALAVLVPRGLQLVEGAADGEARASSTCGPANVSDAFSVQKSRGRMES